MGQKSNYGAKDWGVGDRVGLLIDFQTSQGDFDAAAAAVLFDVVVAAGGEITFYKNGILMEIGAKNVAFQGGITGLLLHYTL